MKLQKLLNESSIGRMPLPPKGMTDNPVKFVEKYVEDFQTYTAKQLKGKFIAGFDMGVDQHSGTFEWQIPDGDYVTVLATPFWEDEPMVPVTVIDHDGDDHEYGSIPFVPSYDMKTDYTKYVRIMNKLLPTLKKKYFRR